jgi:cystathionine beta-lyase/cystathionine gamma-synthase
MGFSTDAIHAGQKPDEVTGAVITPVYLTTTYAQEELGKNKGYEYGRTQNFTREALENNVAALEKAKHGVAFSSGVAAINAIMGLLKAGDHVIASDNIYGGTYRLFEAVIKNYNIDFSWVDASNEENIKRAIRPNTKMVFVETPTNPMLTLIDLKMIADVCQKNDLVSVVDNTFMSPFFQNPILYGIDVVVHSSTKYLNGHSDVIGGIVLTNDEAINDKLKFIQNASGAVPSPFDCWLTLRSTKTLAVRMERHNYNAQKIAEHLLQSGKVKKVFYPGLANHPQHELAKKQMTGFGGVVSVDLGDYELTKKFLSSLKIFTLAESLGGVESLVCHPYTMSHHSMPENLKEKFGITKSVVRLSVGIEDVEDLIADLDNAL